MTLITIQTVSGLYSTFCDIKGNKVSGNDFVTAVNDAVKGKIKNGEEVLVFFSNTGKEPVFLKDLGGKSELDLSTIKNVLVSPNSFSKKIIDMPNKDVGSDETKQRNGH